MKNASDGDGDGDETNGKGGFLLLNILQAPSKGRWARPPTPQGGEGGREVRVHAQNQNIDRQPTAAKRIGHRGRAQINRMEEKRRTCTHTHAREGWKTNIENVESNVHHQRMNQ